MMVTHSSHTREDETVDRWTEGKELAMAAFQDTGPDRLNCAQAVVLCAAHGLGYDEKAVAIARYMGGGSVGMGEMCGALEGAVVGLGLRDYFALADHPAVDATEKDALQALIRDFGARFGSAACRDLTGYDLSTKEGHDRFKADPVSKRCDDYVAWVCDRLGAMLP
jgi:C_GCAxxG_C_C family probable redox protein